MEKNKKRKKEENKNEEKRRVFLYICLIINLIRCDNINYFKMTI
jgi:hypothetical protein